MLLTLAIVGIVASITIPALLSSYEKQSQVAGLQKAMVVFQNAIKRIMLDKQISDLSGEMGNDANATLDLLCSYLQCTKKCYADQDSGGCFHSDGNTWAVLNGDPGWVNWTNSVRASLADGSMFRMGYNKYCTWAGFVVNGQSIGCLDIYVDVNGFKKPNRLGRDIFNLAIIKDGQLYPRGAQIETSVSDLNVYCNPASTDYRTGLSCAAKIQLEGWKMDY